MSELFWCRYCGKQKPWRDRNYDVGLFLAEAASFEALGHTEHVSPYLICNQCADDVIKEREAAAWNRRKPEVYIGVDLASGQDFTFFAGNPERSEG